MNAHETDSTISTIQNRLDASKDITPLSRPELEAMQAESAAMQEQIETLNLYLARAETLQLLRHRWRNRERQVIPSPEKHMNG